MQTYTSFDAVSMTGVDNDQTASLVLFVAFPPALVHDVHGDDQAVLADRFWCVCI